MFFSKFMVEIILKLSFIVLELCLFLLFIVLPPLIVFLHFLEKEWVSKEGEKNNKLKEKLKKCSIFFVIPFLVSIPPALFFIRFVWDISFGYEFLLFLFAIQPILGFLAGLGIVIFIFFFSKSSFPPVFRVILGILIVFMVTATLFLFSPYFQWFLSPP